VSTESATTTYGQKKNPLPTTGLRRVELVLPEGMLKEIREYLLRDTTNEYACYLLCGHHIQGRTLRLLGCFLVLPEEADYEAQSIGSVRVRRGLLIEVLKECERHGVSLIDIHSHPFATNHVAFSGIDEHDEQEKAVWFAQHLPRAYYGSIVFGKNSHRARIRSAAGTALEADLPIRTIGIPLQPRSRAWNRANVGVGFADRHIRAFGVEGQRRIGMAHFGIVGLGGLGSALAIGLARLGAKRFVLIDPDRSELHNLNRVAGMTATDAKLHIKKADLVARELLAINPNIQLRVIDTTVLNRRAWRALISSDLIVTATDNHASRMFLNVVSQQYLLPQISIGSLIDTAEGKLEGGYGHVYTLLPGHNHGCLLCSRIVNPIEAYYESASDEHRRQAAKRGYITDFDEPAPSVVHLNGVLVHLALVEIHNLFCGFKEPAQHLLYDMCEQEIVHVIEDKQDCATCSPGGGYFGRGDLVSLKNIFAEISKK
jgi:molybdopterin/thiamine biosynthesis adenylyltransferase